LSQTGLQAQRANPGSNTHLTASRLHGIPMSNILSNAS
jgi:hypothetical protein